MAKRASDNGSGDVLSRRALNRATLARQLLLAREDRSPEETIEHLVGMQAQVPTNPYVALWSRLDGFRPDDLGALVTERRVVRIALMRSTIHLVTARDCMELRPLVQPILDRSLQGNFHRHLDGLDVDAVVAAGRTLVEEQPLTFSRLGASLAERWPGREPLALTQVVRARVPLVQVPPRGVWGLSGQATHTSAEAWLGRSLAAEPSVDDLVLRYLGAFGPAGVMDVQTWSGLTRLREVVDRLRPRLRTYRDEHGKELFDLPHAPRPDPDTPAPPRLLPEYDNVLLAHADRSRFMAEDGPVLAESMFWHGAVLVDGCLLGTWDLTRARGAATLVVRPFARLRRQDREALGDEATRLLEFAAADAKARNIRLDPPV
ncbi:MAG: winged helix DNA-binding domain-containing protein [Acidimicrobiales bacterium]